MPEAPWSRAIDSLARAESLVHELLGRWVLVAGARRLRPVEVELYLYTQKHPDPFTHGHVAQQRAGYWYLHRSGPQGGFKGGSFKGIDLACGAAGAPAGILVRSLLRDDGQIVCGPSLCVDELLAATGCPTVAALDQAFADRRVDDVENPVHLRADDSLAARPVYRTGRVGLTLKNASDLPLRMDYVLRRYRWLTAPRAIKKGRLLLLLALLEDGVSAGDIQALTGSPSKAVARAQAGLGEGRALPLADFVGQSLDSAALARMYGSFLAARAGRS